MSQNSERLSWTFEEVDAKLQQIMINIFHNLDDAAKKYGKAGNYVVGANIASLGNTTTDGNSYYMLMNEQESPVYIISNSLYTEIYGW